MPLEVKNPSTQLRNFTPHVEPTTWGVLHTSCFMTFYGFYQTQRHKGSAQLTPVKFVLVAGTRII